MSPATRLFDQQLAQSLNKERITAPQYWPFMMRIHHQWPMESPHKGPVMRKAFHIMTSSRVTYTNPWLIAHIVSRNGVHDPSICSDEEYSKLLYQNLSRLMLFGCGVINLLPSDVHSRNMNMLIHWGRDKMDTISQTMFSNAFSWMKMYKFRFRFHLSLFLRVQLTTYQRWFR